MHLLFIASFLFSSSASAAGGLYDKSSPVLTVQASSYDRLISKSNHTSLIEFYAPWCGHCQRLKPAFEKTAKKLAGLAKVAAINCDDESNKAFCSQMGVKGYPTLKIVRPSKKAGGKPIVEEYQGERTAKALVDATVEKIPNHVKRVSDKSVEAWLKESNATAKAVLVTDKGTTSALLRALAIDFLEVINFGQVRSNNKEVVDLLGIQKYPTFMVLPGEEKEAVVYQGEMKKENMKEWLKQFGEPNPDPAPVQKKKKKAAKKETKKPSEAKKEDRKSESPVAIIPTIDEVKLKSNCLSPISKSCVLILLPEKSKEPPQHLLEAMVALLSVHDKHSKRPSNFPFYIIEAANPASKLLRETLQLKDTQEMEVIALNAKRLWWRRYKAEEGFGQVAVEAWVDEIRMNEGKRDVLPESLVVVADPDDVSVADEEKVGKAEIPDKDEL